MTTTKLEVPLVERLKSIPSFFGIRLEPQPHYKVLKHEGHKEIRQYASLILAQTTLKASYREAAEEGFKRLATYIFGENKDHNQISMTTPVIQYQEADLQSWTTSFILPENKTLLATPQPLDDNIKLLVVPAQKWAVLRFSGHANSVVMQQETNELLLWVQSLPNFQIVSAPRWAKYDPPAAISFLKRNEVQVQVENLQ